YVRLNAEEDGAVDSAERLSEIVNPVWIKVLEAIARGVNAALDGAHQLHKIGCGLLQGVTRSNDALRAQHKRGRALRAGDLPVAVLVKTAPALREGHRCSTLLQGQRAVGAKAVANHIDGDGGNAVVRKRGSHREGSSLLAVSKAVAEDRHRPAVAGAWPGGNKQVEEQFFRSLRGNALPCRYLGNKNVAI